jgi:hypothetical protein
VEEGKSGFWAARCRKEGGKVFEGGKQEAEEERKGGVSPASGGMMGAASTPGSTGTMGAAGTSIALAMRSLSRHLKG